MIDYFERDRTRMLMGEAWGYLTKTAARTEAAPHLVGELYASSSGWIMLSAPNAFLRGIFSSLHVPGVELPTNDKGLFNAHITVMRPEEVARIGGVDKIRERGRHFSYQLGPIRSVEPEGWPEVERCWFVSIISPELENLRKSYGLAPLPDGNRKRFHATFAIRKRKLMPTSYPKSEYRTVKMAGELPAMTIDRPRGTKKTFRTPKGPVESTYPVDYGYFNDYLNPDDNEELDVFVGKGQGTRHGRFMKGQTLDGTWKPDERKWYAGLDDDEYDKVVGMYTAQDPTLLADFHEFPDAKALVKDIEPYKRAPNAAVVKVAIDKLIGNVGDSETPDSMPESTASPNVSPEAPVTTKETARQALANTTSMKGHEAQPRGEEMSESTPDNNVPLKMAVEQLVYAIGSDTRVSAVAKLESLLTKEAVTTHSFSDATGTYNLSQLFNSLADRPAAQLPIAAGMPGVNRSKRNGFSVKRLANTDLAYPVIVDENQKLIDGRHRILKALSQGQRHVNAITATPADLTQVRMSLGPPPRPLGSPTLLDGQPDLPDMIRKVRGMSKAAAVPDVASAVPEVVEPVPEVVEPVPPAVVKEAATPTVSAPTPAVTNGGEHWNVSLNFPKDFIKVNVEAPAIHMPEPKAPIINLSPQLNMGEMPAPVVNFNPEIKVAAAQTPVVHVHPEINVEAAKAPIVNLKPEINVKSPVVHVHPEIKVAAAQAPVVNVAAPEVTVKPIFATPPTRQRGRKVNFETDRDGNLTGATIEEAADGSGNGR